MIVRCAAYHCRRTLTDDDAIYCDHGIPFCDAELAEDVCDECAVALAKSCDHWAFHALDTPRRPMDACPTCKAVLRSTTDRQGWIDHNAELRAEDAAYTRALLDDRREMRWGA